MVFGHQLWQRYCEQDKHRIPLQPRLAIPFRAQRYRRQLGGIPTAIRIKTGAKKSKQDKKHWDSF
jgi:hypothetical protein